MKLILDLDTHRCSACGACAIACMDQNDIDPRETAPFRSAFCVETCTGEGDKRTYLSMACMHCADAPCVLACPSGCITKDPETGFTLCDNTNCIGCHSCAMACPFGAPSFRADGKMQKCDGCYARIKMGMQPACVHNCPTEALRLVDEQELKESRIQGSLKKIADRLV